MEEEKKQQQAIIPDEMIQRQLLVRGLNSSYLGKEVIGKNVTTLFPNNTTYQMFAQILGLHYNQTADPITDQGLKIAIEKQYTINARLNRKQPELLDLYNAANELMNTQEDTSSDVVDSLSSYTRSKLAQDRILKASKKAMEDDSYDLTDAVQQAMDEINTIDVTGNNAQVISVYEDFDAKREAYKELQRSVIKTGLPDLDEATSGGLARGELAMVGAKSGFGKALPLTERVFTPNGIVHNGDLQVGDYVYNRLGKAVKVTGIFDKGDLDAYEVVTNDGRKIICSADHLFSYWQQYSHKPYLRLTTKSVKEMLDMGLYRLQDAERKNKAYRFSLPLSAPTQYPDKMLPVDPYTLGALIGDGILREKYLSISASKEKLPILDRIVNNNPSIDHYHKNSDHNFTYTFRRKDNSLIKTTDFGLPKEVETYSIEKRIPDMYLQGSIEQRQALIQGLFDTDGSASARARSNSARASFSSNSPKLIDDVIELLRSLGYKAFKTFKDRNDGRHKNREYQVSVNGSLEMMKDLFSIPVKRDQYIGVMPKNNYYNRASIVSIKNLGYKVPMRCIYVDDPEHLYVAGDYIVTHNTSILSNLSVVYARHGYNVFHVSLEELASRMLLRFDKVTLGVGTGQLLTDNGSINEGFFNSVDQAYTQLNQSGKFGHIYFYRSSPQTVTVDQLKQIIVTYMRQHKVKADVVIIDYPDLLRNPQETDNISFDGGRLFQKLKDLAQSLNVVMWTATQLNRTSSGQDVMDLTAIEGSYQKINILDFACTLNRTKEEYEEGYMRLHLDKIRNRDNFTGDTLFFKFDRLSTRITQETSEEKRRHMDILTQAGMELKEDRKKASGYKDKQDKYIEAKQKKAEQFNANFI